MDSQGTAQFSGTCSWEVALRVASHILVIFSLPFGAVLDKYWGFAVRFHGVHTTLVSTFRRESSEYIWGGGGGGGGWFSAAVTLITVRDIFSRLCSIGGLAICVRSRA